MKKLIIALFNACQNTKYQSWFHFPNNWEQFTEQELQDLAGNLIIDYNENCDDDNYSEVEQDNLFWDTYLVPIDNACQYSDNSSK
jgi:hypothetical protein